MQVTPPCLFLRAPFAAALGMRGGLLAKGPNQRHGLAVARARGLRLIVDRRELRRCDLGLALDRLSLGGSRLGSCLMTWGG